MLCTVCVFEEKRHSRKVLFWGGCSIRKHDLQFFPMPEKSDFGGEALYGSMILTLRQGPEEAPNEGPKSWFYTELPIKNDTLRE